MDEVKLADYRDQMQQAIEETNEPGGHAPVPEPVTAQDFKAVQEALTIGKKARQRGPCWYLGWCVLVFSLICLLITVGTVFAGWIAYSFLALLGMVVSLMVGVLMLVYDRLILKRQGKRKSDNRKAVLFGWAVAIGLLTVGYWMVAVDNQNTDRMMARVRGGVYREEPIRIFPGFIVTGMFLCAGICMPDKKSD